MSIGVHHANAFNSTNFTDCCDVAICDYESCCPRCGKEVIPASSRFSYAFGPEKRRILSYHNERRANQGLSPSNNLCLMCGKPRAECYC